MNTQVNPVPLESETEHTEGNGREMFKAVCKLGLEGIVSKKLDSPYKSGPSNSILPICAGDLTNVTRTGIKGA
jgi:ATP-dependent DNA ligase